jgi:predicted small lipoprotein YifL
MNTSAFRAAILVLASIVGIAALTGCTKKGPFEEAGEEIDDTFDDVGDAIEDAADDVDDAF